MQSRHELWSLAHSPKYLHQPSPAVLVRMHAILQKPLHTDMGPVECSLGPRRRLNNSSHLALSLVHDAPSYVS